MNKKFGVDISKWQKGINLEQVKKEGVEFAILKIGGSDAGRYSDKQFETYYKKCKALGIPVGCYYFGRDLDVASAIASADHMISLMKGHQFEYPVYYDVEGAMVTKTNKENLTKIVKAFCERVEAAGYWVGIYASLSVFNSEMDSNALSHFCKWVAAYRKTKPANYDMWQYGGTINYIRSNKIAGKVVDQDYCYKDYPALIKAKGLNGWGKIEAKPAEVKPVETKPAATTAPVGVKYKVTSKAGLNIRKGPGASYGIVGGLRSGVTIYIYETKTNGKSSWGRTDKGWVSMQYIKKV